ncbi:Conserved_hypothetical protein [Hexamita inflata]|uniref:Uncharacterized protein n=1 Tax=Hexamita inflata TaxID=28002 RepID=A0AA86Q665_9EUKA|nr:Conserved hypothetical protein [Hexamita inflata]CAI9950634.1 Conserved hypothetical protein [Hexamita inflata]CAI9951983.1 Conserved hypothetical protein [Hexamita inflata]
MLFILELLIMHVPTQKSYLLLLNFVQSFFDVKAPPEVLAEVLSENVFQQLKINVPNFVLEKYKQIHMTQLRNQIPTPNTSKLVQFYVQCGQNILFDSKRLSIFSQQFDEETDPGILAYNFVQKFKGENQKQAEDELKLTLKQLPLFDQMRLLVVLFRYVSPKREFALQLFSDLFEDINTLLTNNKLIVQTLTDFLVLAVFYIKQMNNLKCGFVLEKILKLLQADKTIMIENKQNTDLIQQIINNLKAQIQKPNRKPKPDQLLHEFLAKNHFDLFENQDIIFKFEPIVEAEAMTQQNDAEKFINSAVKGKLQEEPRIDIEKTGKKYYNRAGRYVLEQEQEGEEGFWDIVGGLFGWEV